MTKPIIPDAALGQHIAVLGKTGSGKTYAAKGIIERLLEEKRRVGIVDPTGAWYGLRSSRDGRGAGFPVLVLGGDHGDLPLPALGGAAVARLLVEQGVNLIADTSALTVGESARWFIDFAGALYRLNKAPLHLVLDEAHNFAPQGKVPDPDTGKMLHAANRLASGGRSRGIRLVMITQRPQKLHKDTLTSADTLIAMRVLAPHDRLAVEDWIKGCGDIAQGKEVLNSLASLQRGEGWVWYPEGKFLERMKFPPIRTFDSSATPTDGHAIAAPKGAAEVDLTEIRAALADAVKEAEANDPRLLRARVAELERELKKSDTKPDAGYLAGRTDGERIGRKAGREELAIDIQVRLHTAQHAMGAINDLLVQEQTEPIKAAMLSEVLRAAKPAFVPPARIPVASQSYDKESTTRLSGNGALSKAERQALTALAQYPQGRSAIQIAVITGYAVNGGGFRNALGALRTKGYIEGGGDRMVATQAGTDALGSFDPLPTGPALLQHWYGQLGKAERKALEALADEYPKSLSVQQIANRAGYEAEGGGFRNDPHPTTRLSEQRCASAARPRRSSGTRPALSYRTARACRPAGAPGGEAPSAACCRGSRGRSRRAFWRA